MLQLEYSVGNWVSIKDNEAKVEQKARRIMAVITQTIRLPDDR
jgi:hypothetical protein